MRCSPFGVAALTLLLLLAGACSDAATTAPRSAGLTHSAADVADVGTTAPLWSIQIEGVDDGAAYAIFRPTDWNGGVVYYAHGIIDPALPVLLPTNDDAQAIRDSLGRIGYAVAYSSFGENGYAFADGLRHTRALRDIFRERVGEPNRSFLIGHSLGGQIVQAIAEKQAHEYDGALALCGVVGGTTREVAYIGHVRTIFDYFYPNWLPGTNTMSMPNPALTQNEIIGRALAAMQADGFAGFGKMLQIEQAMLAGRNFNEKLNTLFNVLVYHARGVNDFLGRTDGDILFDNSATVYTGGLPPDTLEHINATVNRYTATHVSEKWLGRSYEPTGKLQIPLLTVHKEYDRLVPYGHEAGYGAIVADRGRTDLLRQQTVADYGHCEFGVAATMTAFGELVRWAETVRPGHNDPVVADAAP
jgi:pimeloyl-ACP methyl ester carboxylesterase